MELTILQFLRENTVMILLVFVSTNISACYAQYRLGVGSGRRTVSEVWLCIVLAILWSIIFIGVILRVFQLI